MHLPAGPLLALAAGPQVASVALAEPTGIGPIATALAAGWLSTACAPAEAVVSHGHLQRVSEAGWFDGEDMGGVIGRAAAGLHRHLEGDLGRKGEGGVRAWPETAS